MAQVVHIQTQINVTFGLLDDDGDALPQQPITATVGKFSAEAFAEAFHAIRAERDKLAQPVAENGNGNRAQRRAKAKTV